MGTADLHMYHSIPPPQCVRLSGRMRGRASGKIEVRAWHQPEHHRGTGRHDDSIKLPLLLP